MTFDCGMVVGDRLPDSSISEAANALEFLCATVYSSHIFVKKTKNMKIQICLIYFHNQVKTMTEKNTD